VSTLDKHRSLTGRYRERPSGGQVVETTAENLIRYVSTLLQRSAFQACSFNKGSGSGDRCTWRASTHNDVEALEDLGPGSRRRPSTKPASGNTSLGFEHVPESKLLPLFELDSCTSGGAARSQVAVRNQNSANFCKKCVYRPQVGAGEVSGTISATAWGWAWRPAKGHENHGLGRMAVVGAARSR
jgi:hypothetical protein